MAIPHKDTGDQLLATEVNEIVDRLPYAHIFDNVAEMQDFTEFEEGDFVNWRGYYTPGDGGENYGEFHTTWDKPHDGGTVFGIGVLGKVVAAIHNREVNFLQFGAVDNGTNTIFENDSSDAIQRCLDSDFHVRASAGFYYIAETLHMQRSKHLEMLGTGAPDYLGSMVATPPHHTDIYTDLNIDMIRVESQDVRITGGLWDTSQAPVHNRSAIYMDPSKGTFKTRIDTTVIGNRDRLGDLGNGTHAVSYDWTEAGWQHASSSFDRIDITAHYCKHAFYMTEKTQPQWAPWIEVKANVLYTKQPIFLGTGSNIRVQAYIQCGRYLNTAEKDWYQVYVGMGVGDVFLDVEFSDLHSDQDPDTGNWGPKGGVENHSRGCVLERGSFEEIPIGNIIEWEFPYANNKGYYIDCRNFTMSTKFKNNTDGSYISDIHSTLIGVDKRVTTVLKAYDGTGFDFDTQLNPASTYSLSELSGVTFDRLSGLYDKSTTLPTNMIFSSPSTNAGYFVEIVIPESRAYKYFDLRFDTTRLNFTSMQIIKTVSGSPESYTLFDRIDTKRSGGSSYDSHQVFPSASSGGLIIRLIGFTGSGSTNMVIFFNEIAAYARYSPLGVISISGGAENMGRFDFRYREYRKEFSSFGSKSYGFGEPIVLK